jgi:phage tail-like protein
MARAQITDYLQSMRFFANVTNAGGATRLNLNTGTTGGSTPQAGFSTCSTPEATVESVDYKEGEWVYTRKFPGNPSMGDITMERGVTRGDSSFWDWLRVVIEGSGEYRADIDILHFHRDNALSRPFPTTGAVPNLTNLDLQFPARVYHVHEAFPTRHKVAADLDATASEVSIMSLDIAYENFEVEEKAPVGINGFPP